MDSKGLKLPVSESNKMEASVLGCRLSEKAEHLPIKKRRFLFMNSSPQLSTSSTDETESVAASVQSPSQDAHLKPNANCPPAASLTVADLHQTESNDSKLDVQKFVKYSKRTTEKEDIRGTSVAPGTIDFKAVRVKLENMSAKVTDFHISTAPSKDVAASMVDSSIPNVGHIPTAPSKDVASSMVDSSIPKEPTFDNSCSQARKSECTKQVQVTSNTQKSAALDDRLNWDLNTIMAWEEQQECDHNFNNCKEGKPEHYEQGKERGSVSENIQNKIPPVKLKGLIPKIEGSELEECKPVCNKVRNLLSPVTNSPPLVAVNNVNFVQNQHADSSIPDAIPNSLTLKYPVCEISAKCVNAVAASKDFTFITPGFDHVIDKRDNVASSKIVGSGSNVKHTIASVQTTENDKLKLSLVTGPSLENRVQIGSTFDEDDKANVKRVITSNGIANENLISRGTEISQNVLVSSKSVASGNYVNHAMAGVQTIENEKLNLSLVTGASTETVVPQSGSTFDDEDDKAKVSRVITNKGIATENPPSTVSSVQDVVCSDAEVPLQSGKSLTDFSSDTINNKKEACDYENFPCDVQAGSEVDNIDEVSFGYDDSQFEDGEFRESSIQTWEGNDGEDIEVERGTENRGASGTQENDSLKSTDVESQKGTDEISSVLLPEKLDSSDQISGSEQNVTGNCITEVNMKDAGEPDQWKMNVSGSTDLLPENHSSSSNITKLKDLNSIKSSSRISEDLETKTELSRFYRSEPSTRDAFLSRSRIRMQGSSSNADESASRSVRDSGIIRSVGRGKYTRGGSMWDRSPPFLRSSFCRSLPEDGHMTDEVGVDPNVTHGTFRSRLMVNSEEDEFRARLGLRPSGDTCHNRFVNVGRGRSLRYGSGHNDVGPRERYYGHPANDEPSIDYPHAFPARRRCFSPTHHHSGSTSPPRTRTRSPIGDCFRGRSRSPNLRSDSRMQREPNYRHGFEADHTGGYSLEQSRKNNSPLSSRFLKYRERSFTFDRRSPPIAERLSFYESSRNTKQNENYRSSRFSELNGGRRDGDVMDHGYRRGGFGRPYDMGRPVKHIQCSEEDGYGPPVYDPRDKEALEFHGRGNAKPYIHGTDTRFRDLPRRPREDRDKW